MTERPCAACPWVSRDPVNRAAVADPAVQASMKAGGWFCCHVNMGTCHGAVLRYEQHLRKEQSGGRESQDLEGAPDTTG